MRTCARIGVRAAALLVALCFIGGAALERNGARALAQARASLRPTLIVVAIDGMHPDFRDRVRLPNLERLIARGVRAEWMIPSFPTKTFPNFYTIVTGLYPGHHGIVSNSILDSATGRRFSLSRREEVQDAMWWGGEPIWVTAARAGQRSATMFWPGSEAPIGGTHAAYWLPFDDRMPGGERVARILQWLELPADQRPTFLTLYFEQVDNAGHRNPDSPQLTSALLQVDRWVGDLLDGLEQRAMTQRVNVVVLSDHGMSATARERTIVLEDYVSPDEVDAIDLSPTIGLNPKPGREEVVYAGLQRAPHLHVYRKRDSPERWHYRDHPRIPAIVGVVDEGWQLLRRSAVEALDAGRRPPIMGEHGYDPQDPSMRAMFVAAGPAFRAGAVVPPFENVSLYNVFARVLGVTPAMNDGDRAVVDRLLRR